MTRSSVHGSERKLFLVLCLASDILGADLLEEVSNRMRGEARVGALAGQMRERLFQETEGSQEVFENESYFHPFHFQMMKRQRHRIRYGARRAITSIFKDWTLRGLPTSLFHLYYALRPI